MSRPMHLYLVSPILHSFLHQRPQKLAEQFVRRSIPVTFIEPSGFRQYVAGKRPGLMRVLSRSLAYHFGGVSESSATHESPALPAEPGSSTSLLRIASLPVVIPNILMDFEGLERMNAGVFRRAIQGEILSRRSRTERSVVIVQNPFFGAVLRATDVDAIYYDCIDDISLYAGRASHDRFRRYEDLLIRMSRAVFVTSSALEEEVRRAGGAARVVRVPNAVDASWLTGDAAGPSGSERLRGITTPIAGYVGAMREWFDEDLVLSAARAMPDIAFVLVGPVENERRLSRLRGIPNVVFTGRVPREEVREYVARFDVGLIPFRAGGIADRTNPVKLYEYFAMGKPVVATPMKDLEEHAGSGLVYMGQQGRAFIDALRVGLGDRDAARREARIQIARGNTWERAASVMLETIDGTIDA